jgi:hypothetical protein
MSDMTKRLALPFILPGQAQKEIYHNEALTRIDLALHGCVEGTLATPPPDPAEGECWIVGPAANGVWSGRENAIAGWSGGGWRFITPVLGMAFRSKPSGLSIEWLGTGWSSGDLKAASLVIGGKKVVGERQPAVPSPSGGTTIDQEARLAIAAITAALMSHGLIE